jgi:hypothetical protein
MGKLCTICYSNHCYEVGMDSNDMYNTDGCCICFSASERRKGLSSITYCKECKNESRRLNAK